MTPSTPSSVSELMSEVKARLAKPDIAVIERWDKVAGAHDVYSPDLERMSTDLRRLLDICAVYEAALRFIGENAPLEAMKAWQAGSLLNIIEIDAAAANEALQAADAIAAGEGATE